ncbi:MAG: hypothetical protein AB7E08_02705 [Candidatus Omnitrophota bacterium]
MRIISVIFIIFCMLALCLTNVSSSPADLILRRIKPKTFWDKLFEDLEKAVEEETMRKESPEEEIIEEDIPDHPILTLDPRLKPIIEEWRKRYIKVMGTAKCAEIFTDDFIPKVYKILKRRGELSQLEDVLKRSLEILKFHLDPRITGKLNPLRVESWLDDFLLALRDGTFWSQDWWGEVGE